MAGYHLRSCQKGCDLKKVLLFNWGERRMVGQYSRFPLFNHGQRGTWLYLLEQALLKAGQLFKHAIASIELPASSSTNLLLTGIQKAIKEETKNYTGCSLVCPKTSKLNRRELGVIRRSSYFNWGLSNFSLLTPDQMRGKLGLLPEVFLFTPSHPDKKRNRLGMPLDFSYFASNSGRITEQIRSTAGDPQI